MAYTQQGRRDHHIALKPHPALPTKPSCSKFASISHLRIQRETLFRTRCRASIIVHKSPETRHHDGAGRMCVRGGGGGGGVMLVLVPRVSPSPASPPFPRRPSTLPGLLAVGQNRGGNWVWGFVGGSVVKKGLLWLAFKGFGHSGRLSAALWALFSSPPRTRIQVRKLLR